MPRRRGTQFSSLTPPFYIHHRLQFTTRKKKIAKSSLIPHGVEKALSNKILDLGENCFLIIRIGSNWLSWPNGVIVCTSAFKRRFWYQRLYCRYRIRLWALPTYQKQKKFPTCKTNFPTHTHSTMLAYITQSRNCSQGKTVRALNVTSHHEGMCKSGGRLRLKCDGTRAETRFRLSATDESI